MTRPYQLAWDIELAFALSEGLDLLQFGKRVVVVDAHLAELLSQVLD